MQLFKNTNDFFFNEKTIVTIGSFDGLHLGHQYLLQKIVNEASNNSLKSLIFTFYPTANQFFSKNGKIKQLNTIEERIKLIENKNIDFLVIQPFSKYFANLDAEIFVKEILVNQFKVSKLIIGYDHRFGKNRSAGYEELKEFGKKYNFEVLNISAFEKENIVISSTKIREYLDNGNIEYANKLLGYSFNFQGKVIHGKKIGANLGFPTANLEMIDENKIVPKIGVYFVKIIYQNDQFYGMLNIGNNPTFNNNKQSIEVHIFDFQENIYDKSIEVVFLKKIRDEIKFNSKELLIKQLEEDKKTCLNIIAKTQNN